MADIFDIEDNKPLLVTVFLIIDSLHFVFARLLLPHIAPAASVMYILTIATIEVGLYGLIRKRLHFEVFIRHRWFFLVIGFLVAASTSINFEAVAFIDAGTATILGRATILFGLGFGLIWLKENLERLQLAGALIAIGGVFTIAFQPVDCLRFGSLLILCSTFMYALHAAITKRYGEHIEFLDFFFFRLLCTSGILFIVALSRQSLIFPGARVWLLLILVGTVDVAISRSLYYLALRRLKMSIHAIVLALSPVAAILWALLLFDTLPNLQQLIGGFAVISGVLMAVNGVRHA